MPLQRNVGCVTPWSAYSRNRQPVRKIQRIATMQMTMVSMTAKIDSPTGTSASPKNDQRNPETR